MESLGSPHIWTTLCGLDLGDWGSPETPAGAPFCDLGSPRFPARLNQGLAVSPVAQEREQASLQAPFTGTTEGYQRLHACTHMHTDTQPHSTTGLSRWPGARSSLSLQTAHLRHLLRSAGPIPARQQSPLRRHLHSTSSSEGKGQGRREGRDGQKLRRTERTRVEPFNPPLELTFGTLRFSRRFFGLPGMGTLQCPPTPRPHRQPGEISRARKELAWGQARRLPDCKTSRD